MSICMQVTFSAGTSAKTQRANLRWLSWEIMTLYSENTSLLVSSQLRLKSGKHLWIQFKYILRSDIFRHSQTHCCRNMCVSRSVCQCFVPLPSQWRGPYCSSEWSLYPGSRTPPHTRCRLVPYEGWCAPHGESSSPRCRLFLPLPSRYQLSVPAFVWVREDAEIIITRQLKIHVNISLQQT